MRGTRFITKKFVGTSVTPDETKLLLRSDVDAALQDAALAAKRNSRLGGKPAIIACAISDAHSHRGGDSHEFSAMPARVLKGLGVLSAGEGR